MSSEIEIYKRNRKNELTNIFNSNVARLYSKLKSDIINVQRSRIRNKNTILNNLIIQYNNNISSLTKNYNSSIQNVNSFIPEFMIDSNTINTKKALLIGINYINTPYQLSGCIDDTNRMKEFLTKYGFKDFKIITDLTSVKPTKVNILNELKNLILNAKSGDILFFYYSGHGSYTFDRNSDESDRRDETLISSDLQSVLDDELKNIIKTNLKKNITIVGLFDSCHSGTVLDIKYTYLDSNNYNNYSENNNVSECDGNVIMLSGCMDSQTSTEAFINNTIQGALTWSFIQSLNSIPNCSWRELLLSMRTLLKNSSFTQIPQLSTDSIYDINSKVFI